MNKEELIGKLQMVYIGDINALNEMIGYYDGLKEVIEMVQQENSSLRTRIKTIKRRRKHQTQKLNKYKLVVTDLRNALEKKNNKIDKAIEYIAEHKISYFKDGILYATEFDSMSSPHYLLSILKDSDVDE